MNELARLTGGFVFGGLVLAAFFAVLFALFPRRVSRTRAMADGSPGRSFALGLVNAVFLTAMILALLALSQWTGVQLLGVPALALIGLLTAATVFGLAGVIQLVGERLLPQQAELGRTIWGTLAVSLGCAAPFVGWFGLLPYVVILGLGAFILTFFDRHPGAAR